MIVDSTGNIAECPVCQSGIYCDCESKLGCKLPDMIQILSSLTDETSKEPSDENDIGANR
jgi:hypothetical protein